MLTKRFSWATLLAVVAILLTATAAAVTVAAEWRAEVRKADAAAAILGFVARSEAAKLHEIGKRGFCI